jgi:hypothetical protein
VDRARGRLADQLLDLLAGERAVAGERGAQGGGGRLELLLRRVLLPRAQPQLAARVAHGAGERPVVARRDEVDRDPHQRALDDLALLQGLRQRDGGEVPQPRPQPEVHRRRVLGLDTAQPLERVRRRSVRALQQQLPREQRPIELPPAERAHGADSTETPTRRNPGSLAE